MFSAPNSGAALDDSSMFCSGAEYALILSGDHIYRMDYAAMLRHHVDTSAEVTVACLTVGLDEALGEPVIVENRTGSGGHVAGDFVAKAVPDGYTLLQATIAHNAAFAMYLALTYDPARDLQPIVLLGESQGVLLVHPSLPVRSVKEFVALAKARPGELNYGSAGAGTAIHMATELFKWMAKVDLTHIAYKGSTPAMIDLIGGNIQLMFENVASGTPHVNGGKVRALGVTGRTRAANLPGIAPIAESGVPDYEAVPYYTLSTSSKVAADIVRKLAAGSDAFIKARDFGGRYAEFVDHRSGIVVGIVMAMLIEIFVAIHGAMGSDWGNQNCGGRPVRRLWV